MGKTASRKVFSGKRLGISGINMGRLGILCLTCVLGVLIAISENEEQVNNLISKYADSEELESNFKSPETHVDNTPSNMTLAELIQTFSEYEIMPSVHKNQCTTISHKVHQFLESRKKTNPNRVPTIMTNYGLAYMIAARIWYPPKGKISVLHFPLPTDSPLPFTGIYDIYGTCIVNCNGKHVPISSLNSMDRLKRAQPPWCMLTKGQKQSLLKQWQQCCPKAIW